MHSRAFCPHVYSYLFYSIWQTRFSELIFVAFIFNIFKKSTTVEILAKVKEGIFIKRNFAEFSFAIHDSTQKNLLRKELKTMLYLQKTLRFSKRTYRKWS